MPSQFNRQTAVPCTLAEISGGAWIQNDGLSPSGVRLPRGVVSRASVLGVIIQKDDASFSLDDGTRVVNVRSFDANPVPVHAQVGDIVLVIGRPREYNGERYVVLEICKRVRNPAWVEYRRKELAWLCANTPSFETPAPVREHPPAPVVGAKIEPQKNPFETLIDRVRELDAGTGADIEELLGLVPDAEKLLRALVEEGELFEIRPGRLKVLE